LKILELLGGASKDSHSEPKVEAGNGYSETYSLTGYTNTRKSQQTFFEDVQGYHGDVSGQRSAMQQVVQ
jgi:hypothetical protein